MISDYMVSYKKALALIITCVFALAASCAVVGYKIYTDWYSKRPQLIKDQVVYRSRLQTNPKDLQAHLNLGITYYQQNRKGQAVSEFRKALRLDPSNVSAMYYIGLMAKEEKNYVEAKKQMKNILRQDIRHEQAAHTLAQIYSETKLYGKSVEYYQYALKITPGSADIMVELGKVYEIQGKSMDAVKQYRQALFYVPDLKPAREGIERLKGKEGV